MAHHCQHQQHQHQLHQMQQLQSDEYYELASQLENLKIATPRLFLRPLKIEKIGNKITKLKNIKSQIESFLRNVQSIGGRGEWEGRRGFTNSGLTDDEVCEDLVVTLRIIENEITVLTEFIAAIQPYDLQHQNVYTGKLTGILNKNAPKYNDTKKLLVYDSFSNHYALVKKLGRGHCSMVLLASHNQTNARVAIKLLRQSGLNSKQRIRVNREIDINSRIHHPNIAEVYHIYQTENDTAFVIELCGGGNLFDFITSKRRMTENEAKHFMRGILKALIYLHSLGIAHRDLKPENLVFDKDDINEAKLKIIDFGFAKSIHDVGGLATPLGTPGYYPKETIYAVEDLKVGSIVNPYTSQVDMWAIGCITYFMIFAIPPFDSENPDSMQRELLINKEVIRARYKFPQDIEATDEAKEFISKLLQKEAIKRMTAIEAFNHRWIRSSSGALPRRRPLTSTAPSIAIPSSPLASSPSTFGTSSPPSLLASSPSLLASSPSSLTASLLASSPPQTLSPMAAEIEKRKNFMRHNINHAIDICKDEIDEEDMEDCGLEGVDMSNWRKQ